jgi:5-methylcytosine-specific restriction endonuclease McrA
VKIKMPIRPENKGRYPDNWKDVREKILKRAKNKCEFCGVKNYSYREKTKIILTIAHLDHTPENCNDDNLKALCQRCHLQYDQEEHRKNKIKNKLKKSGQKLLFPDYFD